MPPNRDAAADAAADPADIQFCLVPHDVAVKLLLRQHIEERVNPQIAQIEENCARQTQAILTEYDKLKKDFSAIELQNEQLKAAAAGTSHQSSSASKKIRGLTGQKNELQRENNRITKLLAEKEQKLVESETNCDNLAIRFVESETNCDNLFAENNRVKKLLAEKEQKLVESETQLEKQREYAKKIQEQMWTNTANLDKLQQANVALRAELEQAQAGCNLPNDIKHKTVATLTQQNFDIMFPQGFQFDKPLAAEQEEDARLSAIAFIDHQLSLAADSEEEDFDDLMHESKKETLKEMLGAPSLKHDIDPPPSTSAGIEHIKFSFGHDSTKTFNYGCWTDKIKKLEENALLSSKLTMVTSTLFNLREAFEIIVKAQEKYDIDWVLQQLMETIVDTQEEVESIFKLTRKP